MQIVEIVCNQDNVFSNARGIYKGLGYVTSERCAKLKQTPTAIYM